MKNKERAEKIASVEKELEEVSAEMERFELLESVDFQHGWMVVKEAIDQMLQMALDKAENDQAVNHAFVNGVASSLGKVKRLPELLCSEKKMQFEVLREELEAQLSSQKELEILEEEP